MATSLPSAVVIRVCQTIVRRPRWMGVVSPMMRDPAGAAPTKFVLLSMVVVGTEVDLPCSAKADP
jgi:hypothetical protein